MQELKYGLSYNLVIFFFLCLWLNPLRWYKEDSPAKAVYEFVIKLRLKCKARVCCCHGGGSISVKKDTGNVEGLLKEI